MEQHAIPHAACLAIQSREAERPSRHRAICVQSLRAGSLGSYADMPVRHALSRRGTCRLGAERQPAHPLHQNPAYRDVGIANTPTTDGDISIACNF